MRVLVTGASGFVGTATCAYLEAIGHEVIRLVGPGRESEAGSFSVDIGDPSTFPSPESISPLDAVVHCAGIAHRFGGVSKEDFAHVNVKGVENVVKFAEQTGVRKFALLSSALVYGTPRNAEPIGENHPVAPDDDYGASKLEGEKAAVRMCDAASIDLSVLRPAPIVGEGSRGNVSRLIRAIDRGRFVWVGDGRNLRSFVYVGDVARAIGLLLTHGAEAKGSFNLVGGTLTVSDLVQAIETTLEKRTPRIGVPSIAAHALYRASAVASPVNAVERYRRTLRTWLADGVYSGAKIESELGVAPATSIEDAVSREVEHYLRTK